jgi:hypothetical protein
MSATSAAAQSSPRNTTTAATARLLCSEPSTVRQLMPSSSFESATNICDRGEGTRRWLPVIIDTAATAAMPLTCFRCFNTPGHVCTLKATLASGICMTGKE